jgi:hypothetical protein
VILVLSTPLGLATAQSPATLQTDSLRSTSWFVSAVDVEAIPVNESVPNDFMDLERDLTACISSNPLPGCGRQPTGPGDRGGWQQFLLFGIMAGGIGFIVWRIGRSIRARDRLISASTAPSQDAPTSDISS